MEELQLQHAPEQWRLFVDLSEVSLRTVLLHNGNKHPSIPLAYAVHIKETSANIQGLLEKKKIWRPPVEHLCWPEGCGIADWAGRRLYKVLLLPLWMGQLTEGQALLWKAMATPRRNDSRSEECITSSFRGQDENIFNSSSLKTWIN